MDSKPLTEARAKKLKKSVTDNPNSPKGCWHGHAYIFDKEND